VRSVSARSGSTACAPGRGQLLGRELAGGHADRAGPGGQRGADVQRRVADQHRGRAAEVAAVDARRPVRGQVHQFGPDRVRVAVGPDGQVQVLGQAQRAELDLGQGTDVAGQQRLDHVPVGQRGHRLGRPGQHPAPLRHQTGQVGGMGRHQLVEGAENLLGLGHPGQGQHLERDGPVGPARHGARLRHRPAEQLAERRLVELPADPVRVDQRVVDVPEHQQPTHAATVSAPAPPPGSSD
jgi:hypothetical protein